MRRKNIEGVVALDGKSGITYIGEYVGVELVLFRGIVTIRNYIVIPTIDLKSERVKSYSQKSLEAYESFKKDEGSIPLKLRDIQTEHWLKLKH